MRDGSSHHLNFFIPAVLDANRKRDVGQSLGGGAHLATFAAVQARPWIALHPRPALGSFSFCFVWLVRKSIAAMMDRVSGVDFRATQRKVI
jgi:hypothetical protein